MRSKSSSSTTRIAGVRPFRSGKSDPSSYACAIGERPPFRLSLVPSSADEHDTSRRISFQFPVPSAAAQIEGSPPRCGVIPRTVPGNLPDVGLLWQERMTIQSIAGVLFN